MQKKPKIAIILMRYPARTETFATRDFLELGKSYSVDVISYFSGDKINSMPKWSPNLLFSIIDSIRSADKFFFILRLMFAHKFNFRHFVKTIALTPLSISIFNKIIENKVDLVHLYWGHYPSLVALLIKEFSDIKTTSFLGAYDLEERFWGTSALSKTSINYVTHCNYNIRLLRLYYDIKKNNVLVMYRSLNVQDFYIYEKQKHIGSKLNITFTGRCCKEKGVYHIMNVLLQLHCSGVDFTMNFIGDGEERVNITNLSRQYEIYDKIIFYGWLDPVGVRDILRCTDVFLFLSEKVSERLPNAIKEAMLSLCYVISSNSKGINELVPHGAGSIHRPDDYKSILDCIIYCSKNIEFMRRSAKIGQSHILKNFNISINMKKQARLWNDLIAFHE